MPWTIWKHTTVELWKLLLLTTAVLVGVISFAITIKPLADGDLSAFDAIRFMILATIPMLSYALPFGAGFAATLVFHRMAQDNELSASHAGGIGHAKLLVPAAASGLVLAVIVGLLSDQVIPRFLRKMEQMITQDVARLMVGRLSAGETVEFNGNLIYADSVQRIDPSTMRNAAGAEDVISLYRAVFGRLDENRRLQSGGTAERAFIVIYRDAESGAGSDSIVGLVADNFNLWGDSVNAESSEKHQQFFRVPSAFKDDPKFRSLTELRELKADPRLLPKIRVNHDRLGLRAASIAMLQEIDRSLRDTGSVSLSTTQGETITISARGLGRLDWLKRPFVPNQNGEIVIERQRSTGEITRSVSSAAVIDTVQADEPSATRVLAKLTLSEVTTSADDSASGRRRDQQITGVLAPSDQTASLRSLGFDELLDQTGYGGEGVPPALAEVQRAELRSNGHMQRESVSKAHMRVAMSAACFVMLLVGATVAIRLRDALPLTVYLWAFFPALGAVLIISTSEQWAQDSLLPGLLVMWAAVLGLLAYAYATYRRVSTR